MTSPAPFPAPAAVPGSGLSLRALHKEFRLGRGRVSALDGVDLDTSEGQFLSLVGPSGCGKSTVLRILADLERPTSAPASFNGRRPGVAPRRPILAIASQATPCRPWQTAPST